MQRPLLLTFVQAVWSHWEARFGSTFAFGFAISQQIVLATIEPRKIPLWIKDFPPSLWLIFGAGFLVWSFYAAWRTERAAYTALATRLAKPKFSLSLNSNWQGSTPNGRSFLLVSLCLANPIGPPSAARDWAVSVVSDGVKIRGEEPMLTVEDTKIPIGDGRFLRFGKSTHLPSVSTVPIPAGGMVTGWISVTFENIPDIADLPVEISTTDVASNNKHCLNFVIEAKVPNAVYIPGEGVIRRRPPVNR